MELNRHAHKIQDTPLFWPVASNWILHILPEQAHFLLAILPSGAFMALAVLIALKQGFEQRWAARLTQKTPSLANSSLAPAQ